MYTHDFFFFNQTGYNDCNIKRIVLSKAERSHNSKRFRGYVLDNNNKLSKRNKNCNNLHLLLLLNCYKKLPEL